MLTYKIHIVRHGLTDANRERRYIGTTDLSLNDVGKQQLENLRETKIYPSVDRVYSSPLLRATQSAEILFPDRFTQTMEELRELNFGEFENRTADELEQDAAFRKWRASPPSTSTPGGESSDDMHKRVLRAAAHIFAQMMEEHIPSVAVVTHGGLIMSLLASMGLPQREMVQWNCAPGHGYTILLTTQMWMRDKKFEVYGQLPYDRYDEENDFFDVSGL